MTYDFFGSLKLVSTERREGMDLVLGGYSIELDRYGRETSRTENVDHVRIVGYYDPECWGHSPSFMARAKRWINKLFPVDTSR